MKKFNQLCIKTYLKLQENDGMGTIEVVLIAVSLIALVVIFKSEVSEILSNFISKISGQADSIFN